MTNHNDCLLFIWPGLLVPQKHLLKMRTESLREESPEKVIFFGGLGLLCLFQICQCYMLRRGDKKYENFYCGNFQSTFIRNRLIGSANARSRSPCSYFPTRSWYGLYGRNSDQVKDIQYVPWLYPMLCNKFYFLIQLYNELSFNLVGDFEMSGWPWTRAPGGLKTYLFEHLGQQMFFQFLFLLWYFFPSDWVSAFYLSMKYMYLESYFSLQSILEVKTAAW